ncbi:hypothetical protein EOG37_13900 [Clavibacter michiganensis subsp. michiganensis]|uniref:hypothetical protein n=1 Tax=Clavibacter michiganensis TaxID=28447 RepID=UPI001C64C657|nr:hypothetical protein [Clavibacter michiganensis]MBW8027766.1 hypothetical protein [Clavibacter michiganensis subsp. michiganensis]
MKCTELPIECALRDLGNTLTSFNINDLISTTLATVIGVVVGGAFSLWFAAKDAKRTARDRESEQEHLRRLRSDELEARRKDRLQAALVRVIEAINAHNLDLLDLHQRQEENTELVDWLPVDWPVLASVASARMIAKDDSEREILNGIRDFIMRLRTVSIRDRMQPMSEIWRVIILWQDGGDSVSILGEINKLRQSVNPGI